MTQTAGISGRTVRRAQPSDAAALLTLCAELGYPATAPETEERLRAVLRHGDHALFVAEDTGGHVVGCAHGAAIPLLENDLTLQIFALIVSPGNRRRGVGRKLVAAVEEWGAALGCVVSYLRCNVKRDEAHRFWAGVGYENRKTQSAFRKRL